MEHTGRLLIITGAVIALIGVILVAGGRLPWVGRLPGDIVVERRNYTVYIPIATSVILSIVLSFLLWLFGKK